MKSDPAQQLALLRRFAGLKNIEVEVLVPRHKFLTCLLEDIAEIPVAA
jgi:hypothetical protein